MRNPRTLRATRLELLEERRLLAGDTYLVNFQNDEATTPTRYVRDIGLIYGARGGGLTYGWTSDHTDQARERSLEADQRLDTLIHIEAGQSWEFALANGAYLVTVAVGDPANNDGVHTVNVEGVSAFNAVPDGPEALVTTVAVTVSDGRLTINSGAAADKATRIDYVHIVGVSTGGNAAPATPTITEPSVVGQIVNPADVHMEAIGYSDPEGNAHKSTDWEIWTTGSSVEVVWQTLGIGGVERLHTHLGDGVFVNAQAGEIALAANTSYELRVRFRDDAGSVSTYATRAFTTGAASTIFPMQIEDINDAVAPVWTTTLGAPVELPVGEGILGPNDETIAFDFDLSTNSSSPDNEQVANLIDNSLATKYLNFGRENTGFIVTLGVPAAVRSFVLTTANDAADRDPASWVLYGTNATITSDAHSNGREEAWTAISSGSLSLPAARLTNGSVVSFTNATAYSSYKLVFPTVKNSGAANSMQLAEVAFFTSSNGTGPDVLAPGAFIIPIQDIDAVPQSDSSPGEGPENAVDGTVATKYINHGKSNSGLIVTPASGSSTVTSFQLWTANDAPERDPTGWALYGTNAAIQSVNHGTGQAESWTLIDLGAVTLPLTRFAAGPVVAVDNQVGAFTSYRMVFTSLRDEGPADSVQISEVQFYGEGESGGEASRLEIVNGATGNEFIRIAGASAAGNVVTNFPTLGAHASIKIVISAGSNNLSLLASDLEFTTDDGQEMTVFLPNVNLAAGEQLILWVASSGATYYGLPGQTEPVFTTIAREANLNVPYIATKPGFVIEEVGSDYRLPVNIAFVPNPGPNPNDPLYFVTELYGSIQVVTRDGTKHEFATGLLDYNPTGPISGSGEQGLTGIAVMRDTVNPDIYHLFVGMLADNGSPPGGAVHYPKVERLTSVVGGLAMGSRTVLLNMQPETQGQSHQISHISIGPDGKLYVHNGDGFNASTAVDLDMYRGKVLRMNLDGSAPTDNPFYNAANGINARDYVYAYGFRNPFGGAWRAADGQLYEVENGPSVDRFARVLRGGNYGWNGSNASMQIGALYNWQTATAPVNVTFVQPETFRGSQFPAGMQDHAFVSESGPTYAQGPQSNGKRITEFIINMAGVLVDGPDALIEYVGMGHASVVGLAAGPDGLYFTDLYEDSGANGATAVGAKIYRVRYVNPIIGDYDIDGDVDLDDHTAWRETYGSNLLLGADGNRDGVVNAADYTVWRDAFDALSAPAAASASVVATIVNEPASVPVEPTPVIAGSIPDSLSEPFLPYAAISAIFAERGEEAASVRTRYRLALRSDEGFASDRDLLAMAISLPPGTAEQTMMESEASDSEVAVNAVVELEAVWSAFE